MHTFIVLCFTVVVVPLHINQKDGLSEVRDFQGEIPGNKDIGWLQVTMGTETGLATVNVRHTLNVMSDVTLH